MGRQVKRVPYNFNWPLEKVWWGYKITTKIPCQYCVRHTGDSYCPVCEGEGVVYPIIEVPDGNWYQLWDTTADGAPLTPPLETIEELTDYCVSNQVPAFSDICPTRDAWMEFFKQSEKLPCLSSPELAIVDGEILDGVSALSRYLENRDIPIKIIGDNFDNLTEKEYTELNNFFASEFLGDQNAG